MSGFTKLFSTIINSSIWCEDHATLRVWVALMAMANGDGVVETSAKNLAYTCRVTDAECAAALEKFMAPDSDSRSEEYQGRRIERVDGGWRLLNHAKYRAKLSKVNRRAYKAAWQSSYRAKSKPLPGEAKFVAAVQAGAPAAVLDALSDPERRAA